MEARSKTTAANRAASIGAAAQARLLRLATTAALLVAVGLFTAKAIVWLMTGSVALLGSVIDSGLDILATGFNFFAVRHALQPADEEHRFGHGKAEAISGLVQGAFIGGSAAFLAAQSLLRFFHPEPVDQMPLGIAVSLFAIAATLLLVTFQSYVIRRTRSLAIAADELHYRSDLILNSAVLAAFFLAGPGIGWLWADPAIGFLIACYILVSAFRIARRAYDQLMDREFSDEERASVVRIVRAHPEVIALHDLRTRRAGRDAFIQFHLELDPDLPLREAHRISDEVEARLREVFAEAEVIIHEDPAGIDEAHSPLVAAERAVAQG